MVLTSSQNCLFTPILGEFWGNDYRFPLELGTGPRGQKTRVLGLPDGRKNFKIGLAVLTQYRRVTDTQPASQPSFHSKYRGTLRTRRAGNDLTLEILIL